MPSIDVSLKDICNLIGKKLSLKELEDFIQFAKGEIDSVDGDILKIDIKDSNRPDLWSAEGISREIRSRITNDKGLPNYKIGKSNVVVKVDKKVKSVRPFTVCAVAKRLNIDENVLSQMIQLQEKICSTFGRNRKEVALGVYDLKKIKSPIRFTTVKPDGIKFVPLDFEKEMTPKEILEKHPKGKEFGNLLSGFSEYPIFIDSANEVLSLPPIINSEYSGKVTEKTEEIFIECSGFDLKFLMPALNVIVCALADRGAKIESVRVVYPDRTIITPELKPKSFFVETDYVNKVSGLNLKEKEIIKLLEMTRYKTRLNGKKIEVLYPAYRQDIMHQRDIVEDVIVSYGVNKIEPVYPRLATVGGSNVIEIFSNSVSEIMIGLDFQEIMSYNLTNKNNLFKKMNLQDEKIVEIQNPISSSWSVFRNWLTPNLLEFLSCNKHIEYPQKIFEIGNTLKLDETKETKTKDVRKLACAISDTKISYEDISSLLDAFLSSLGIKYGLKTTTHNSFIPGRVAEVVVNNESIGIIGEVHPQVLENWKLETPVAVFEIDLEKIKII